MRGHLPTELLSAFLDGEAGPAEARRVTSHVAVCDRCRDRLEEARQVVLGLRRLVPVRPPQEMAARLRRRMPAPASTALPGGSAAALERWRSWWIRWCELPPLRSSSSRPLGVGLAMLVAVLLVEHGSLPSLTSDWVGSGGAGPRLAAATPAAAPEFLVSAAFGDAPAVLPQTTSQVAGRVFVLDNGVWLQRGLDAGDARQPQARVKVRSPQGRALLAKLSDLDVLLADGSPVVLRYRRETLELWDGS